MKTIEVVAAVIIKDGKVFATKRGKGDFEGGWEFPGGKIEDGETKEEALKREIHEELETDIEIKEFLTTTTYDYPEFTVILSFYLCSLEDGEIKLNVHSEKKWLSKDELDSVSWLPADTEIVERLKTIL